MRGEYEAFLIESFFAHFFKKVFLKIEQLLRKVYVNFLRIYETAGFIPQSILFFLAVCTQIHDFRRSIDTFALTDDWNQKLTEFIGAAEDFGLFPCISRIKNDHSFLRIKDFVCETDKISFDLAGGFAVNTINGLVTRIGDFLSVFGKFDLWSEGTASVIFDCGELIYTTESRVIFAGDQVGADTPGIDFCILSLQAVNQVFVEVT